MLHTPEKVVWYVDRYEVLRHAAAMAPTEGLVLEFGVASGGTIRCLAESEPLQDRTIHGFDTFMGLPEPWGGYSIGHFACNVPDVPDNVELIVGRFESTLAPFLEKHPDNVALVHIDCDLYTSTKIVLNLLNDRIVAGTVIALDEFWIITDQEQRAFNEWLERNGRTCRHEARSIEQLVVVMEN